MSGLESGEEGDWVRDDFPNAELFKVTTETAVDKAVAGENKWLTGMHKFGSGLPLEELSRTSGNDLRYKADIFVWCKTHYITRELTESGDMWSGVTRRKQYYAKLTMELPEDTMPETLPLGRYGEVGYGGPQP